MSSLASRAVVRVASGARAMSGHSAQAGYDGVKLWRNISLFVALPAIGLGMANIILFHEHEPRPEFIKYDYLRVRTKRFPWGDGNHSLFHNPQMNALPDGYEEDEVHH